ncbi:MAG TPA: hypothetical protein VGD98_23480 [Ktedonobacteraceae bacterium]
MQQLTGLPDAHEDALARLYQRHALTLLSYSITGKLLQTYSTQSPLPLPPDSLWSYSVMA